MGQNKKEDYFTELKPEQVDTIIDTVCELKIDTQGEIIDADEYFYRQCDKALKMADWLYMQPEGVKELIQAMKDDRRIVLVQ